MAAMSVEHFLADLQDGTLVIVPDDRGDILAASVAAAGAADLPAVAGIVLTGGYGLHPAMRRLAEEAPFPVLETNCPTDVGGHARSTRSRRSCARDDRKWPPRCGLFESAVDASELGARWPSSARGG